jgi:hypothetical protein
MTADVTPLERLGQAVELRIAELGLEYVRVAGAAGTSAETLSKIRKGTKASAATYRRLERALLWASGSVDAILAGGEPTPIVTDSDGAPPEVLEEDPQTAAVMTILEALPERVQAEVHRRLGDRMPRSTSER